MKIITLLVFYIFLFINGLLGQKPGKSFLLDTGIYKVSAIFGNETIISGYYFFKKNNQYEYFGNAEYNYVGISGNYCTYSAGIWNINIDSVIEINDKIDSTLNLKVADSINYNAVYKVPYDSIFFNIQVLGENGYSLPNELVWIKGFTQTLLQTDGNGKIQFKTGFRSVTKENQMQFLGQEPYYKTDISILPQYNFHQLQVFLKKIPGKGFLPAGFVPKSWKDKIQIVGRDTFKIGKYLYLTKASAAEIKFYVNEFEKVNPYFQPDFKKIKSIFRIVE